MIGLITAVDLGTFDPDLARFYNFAWEWMKGEVLTAAREEPSVVYHPRGQMTQSDVSFNTPLGGASEGEDGATLYNSVADDAPNQEDHLCTEDEAYNHWAALLLALDMLNEREHDVFVARRLTEYPPTLDELAAELGVSSGRIWQIEQAAWKKVEKAAPQALAKLKQLDRKQIYRTLRNQEILDRGHSPETVAWLMTPDGQKHRRRLSLLFAQQSRFMGGQA